MNADDPRNGETMDMVDSSVSVIGDVFIEGAAPRSAKTGEVLAGSDPIGTRAPAPPWRRLATKRRILAPSTQAERARVRGKRCSP
jgi:hypothetical protein